MLPVKFKVRLTITARMVSSAGNTSQTLSMICNTNETKGGTTRKGPEAGFVPPIGYVCREKKRVGVKPLPVDPHAEDKASANAREETTPINDGNAGNSSHEETSSPEPIGDAVSSSNSHTRSLNAMRLDSEEKKAQRRKSARLFKRIACRRVRKPMKMERKKWDKVILKQQSLYDALNSRYRVIRKLWRISDRVRAERELLGASQSSLARTSSALNVRGVIYCIYSFRTRKLYVGQTMDSSFHRYCAHVRSAVRNKNEDLHVSIRKLGKQNFFVFPLEKIANAAYTHVRNSTQRRQAFRDAATPREIFWIQQLHSYSPRGLNMVHSRRNRRNRRRKNNPMMWRRAGRKAESEVPREFESKQDGDNNVESKQNVDSNSRWCGSRDWARRAEFLLGKAKANELASVSLEGYSLRSVRRIIAFVRTAMDDADDAAKRARKKLLAALNTRLLVRPVNTKPPKKAVSVFVRLEWNSHLLKHLNLKGIINDPAVHTLLPAGVRDDLDGLIVVKKLVQPIGKQILNFSKVARLLPANSSNANCPCRRLFPAKFRPDGHCVLTGELDIVQNRALRQLIALGPKFREAQGNERPLQAVKEGLNDLILFMSRKHAIAIEAFNVWRGEILAQCEQKLSKQKQKASEHTVLKKDNESYRYLKFLQRHLVLVPTDKAANNISFVCKALYCDLLRGELQENGSYEVQAESEQDIIGLHEQILKPMHLMGDKKLPYLYAMPKFHKNPVKYRYIAGSGRCTTTKLSKLLSDILTAILRSLREKDEARLVRTGVRRFFTVESGQEVADFLSKWYRGGGGVPNEQRGLKTGDFSTMYTSIPHELLLESLARVCDEAFEYKSKILGIGKAEIRVQWTEGATLTERVSFCRSSFEQTHSAKRHLLSQQKLNELLAFLVRNTFLSNGKSIYRQTVGIPMGTNCAPVLANLFLYDYESRYIDKIEAISVERARQFHLTFRFIDDTLSVDNVPEWEEACRVPAEDGGLYPAALTLNDTSNAPDLAQFVGMEIKGVGNRFELAVFDKRKEFPFHVARFPHMKSLIPTSIPYGVFLGQLHRGFRICSHAPQFLSFAVELGRTLMVQGCHKKRLLSRFYSFICDKVTKYEGSTARGLLKQFREGLSRS
jgi:hypothetical protein